MDFTDKVVLITGAASGIGKQFSEDFLEKGAKVCLCDIDVGKLNDTTEVFIKRFGKENVTQNICDVAKDEDIEAAFNHCEQTLGAINIVINNAGLCNESNWKDTININLGGVIRGCELALKRIGKHNGGNGGHVVNTSSVLGVAPCSIIPFYSASKAGVVQYTRSAGDEFHYKYSGVTVQCLCPYFVDTPFIAKPLPNNPYNEQTRGLFAKIMGSFPRLTTKEVSDGLFQLLSENKKGAAMIVEKVKGCYYAEPSQEIQW